MLRRHVGVLKNKHVVVRFGCSPTNERGKFDYGICDLYFYFTKLPEDYFRFLFLAPYCVHGADFFLKDMRPIKRTVEFNLSAQDIASAVRAQRGEK